MGFLIFSIEEMTIPACNYPAPAGLRDLEPLTVRPHGYWNARDVIILFRGWVLQGHSPAAGWVFFLSWMSVGFKNVDW